MGGSIRDAVQAVRTTIISEGPYLGPATYELGIQETVAAIASVDAAIASVDAAIGGLAAINTAGFATIDATIAASISGLATINTAGFSSIVTSTAATTAAVIAVNGQLADILSAIRSGNDAITTRLDSILAAIGGGQQENGLIIKPNGILMYNVQISSNPDTYQARQLVNNTIVDKFITYGVRTSLYDTTQLQTVTFGIVPYESDTQLLANINPLPAVVTVYYSAAPAIMPTQTLTFTAIINP